MLSRCMGGEMLYAWPVYGRGDALCPVGTWRGVALRLASTLDGKSSMGHGTWSMPSQYLEVLKLTSSDCWAVRLATFFINCEIREVTSAVNFSVSWAWVLYTVRCSSMRLAIPHGNCNQWAPGWKWWLGGRLLSTVHQNLGTNQGSASNLGQLRTSQNYLQGGGGEEEEEEGRRRTLTMARAVTSSRYWEVLSMDVRSSDRAPRSAVESSVSLLSRSSTVTKITAQRPHNLMTDQELHQEAPAVTRQWEKRVTWR